MPTWLLITTRRRGSAISLFRPLELIEYSSLLFSVFCPSNYWFFSRNYLFSKTIKNFSHRLFLSSSSSSTTTTTTSTTTTTFYLCPTSVRISRHQKYSLNNQQSLSTVSDHSGRSFSAIILGDHSRRSAITSV